MDFRFLKRRQPFALFFGLLICAFGISQIPSSILSLYESYLLDNPARIQMTVGKIIGLHEFHVRGGPTFRLDYVYVVGQMNVSALKFISSDNWHRLGPVGASLQINYLIAAPSVSQPVLPGETGYAIRDGWLEVIFAFAAAALGFWAGLFSKKGKRTIRRKRK
jgi:hypothetical protein